MKRMLINEFRREAFVGKPPSPATVKKWIRDGDLPGERIGNSWIVFVDADGNPARDTGNALADSVLSRWYGKESA